MSEHMKDLWTLSNGIDYQTILCVDGLSLWSPSRTRTERHARNKRIVADHNGCIGIIDPETTVPELVAVCMELLDRLNMAHVATEALAKRARAVLAKTKGRSDE